MGAFSSPLLISRKEEEELIKEFGKQYEKYKKRY
jgi:protein-S-isoprenylcysteine O-methyltransferase Ste14